MGIRLIVEVLDHYHGPSGRKLWLLAFAEIANDATRQGWCPRWKLAHRAGQSPEHATRTATALIREGAIKRHGGGYRGHASVYELLPLTERVPPAAPISRGKGATTGTHSRAERVPSATERVPPATGKGATSDGKGATGGTPSLNTLIHPSSPARWPERDARTALARHGATRGEIDFIIAGLRKWPPRVRTALWTEHAPRLIEQARRELNGHQPDREHDEGPL